MIPWIIVAVVAVPILIVAASRMRRKDAAGEHPATETQADRDLVEKEFEESERYQEQWRKEHRHDHDDTMLP